MIVEWKNRLKQNKTGQLTIKKYTFERGANFKYLGVILNEDNNHQIYLQERIKMLTKHTSCYKKNFRSKNIFKKLKLRLKNTTDKTLTNASETWILTKRDRKQINIFERKV